MHREHVSNSLIVCAYNYTTSSAGSYGYWLYYIVCPYSLLPWKIRNKKNTLENYGK